MKSIKIKKLDIKNFKNFSSYTFEPNGEDAVISGRNGTGKSTFKEAWLWLLFGKNGFGKFLNPKPLNDNNERIIGLEPVVEATIMVNDEQLVLRRELREKWTKATGEADKKYTGNTNKFFINEVPYIQKDWNVFINDLVDENAFQILSNSSFFMSDNMHYKKRREMLIEMAGVTDGDIVASDDSLKDVGLWLENKSVDDLMKQFKAELKNNKKEIERKPIEIQTTQAIIDDLKHDDFESKQVVNEKIKQLDARIREQEQLIMDKRAIGNETEYKNKIADLKIKLSDARSSYQQSLVLETQSLNNELRDINISLAEKERMINHKNNEIDNLRLEAKNIIKNIDRIKEEWQHIQSYNFNRDESVCQSCGQDLPSDKIDELEASFNVRKTTALQKLSDEAKNNNYNMTAVEHINENIERLEADKQVYVDEYSALVGQRDKLQDEIKTINATQVKFENTNKYIEPNNEITILTRKIERERVSKADIVLEDEKELELLRSEMREFQSILSDFKQIDVLEEQVQELDDKNRELKNKNLEIEHKIFLLEKFIKHKMTFVQDAVNQFFNVVKFKLFKELENGGLEDICEAMIENNGAMVGYHEGLSTGWRMVADIDIVNTFSDKLGYRLPLFIDNAEAMTEPFERQTQIIELEVNKLKKIKVEVAK